MFQHHSFGIHLFYKTTVFYLVGRKVFYFFKHLLSVHFELVSYLVWFSMRLGNPLREGCRVPVTHNLALRALLPAIAGWLFVR